jgi:hypothetical protein
MQYVAQKITPTKGRYEKELRAKSQQYFLDLLQEDDSDETEKPEKAKPQDTSAKKYFLANILR